MQQKIKIIVLITAVILLRNDLSGQYAEKLSVVNCPVEEIQVHLSHESAFTGEIIFFKIYCTSSLFPTKELSSLAFIELVSSENTSIIRKKILLKHGEGSGEFKIPDNLQTGLYYILAYTNWMKNFGEGSFFRKEIMIINPNLSFTNLPDSLYSRIKKKETMVTNTIADKLKVIPGKKKYSTREHVTMKIETGSMPGKVISGDFSVSVFRKEPPMIFNTKKSKEQVLIKNPEKIIYMPDYKGIRLSGKLEDPSGNAVSGAFVTVSTPGPGTGLKCSITDNAGVFNFIIKLKEGEQEMVIILPAADTKINLDESFWNGFRDPPDNLVFGLDQEAISYLKEKFTHLQFQTRFKKQNFTKNVQVENMADSGLFYSTPDQIIKLSDYFNLDSLREYFYELAPSVKFFTRKGKLEILVFDPVTMNYLENKPGVFIDGVLYDNFAEINKIPVREIDRIAIIPCTYYYKDFTFGGIFDIHTRKSDFNGAKPLPNMTRFIFPIADQSEWKFTSPDYATTGSADRIPDFRYLLYWEPYLKMGKPGEAELEFYAGDVKGRFIVKVVGISENGEILEAENEIYVDD